jgi:hypothetical protein
MGIMRECACKAGIIEEKASGNLKITTERKLLNFAMEHCHVTLNYTLTFIEQLKQRRFTV